MKKQLNTERKLYTLCILVDDTPGVLSQVARLFSRKGYNIVSIVSGATDRPSVARISIEIIGDELMIDQIAAQCRKLLPTAQAADKMTAIVLKAVVSKLDTLENPEDFFSWLG